MVVSRNTQNGVGSRQNKWNIKFRFPHYEINRHTSTQVKKHFGALKNMVIYVTVSNSKVRLKNLLLSSPLWHPIVWSFSFCHPLVPDLFTLCHPLLLASTLISCHPPSFSCLYFFSVPLSSLLCPVNHHVIMRHLHSHLVPRNHIRKKFSLLTVYRATEDSNGHCTELLCAAQQIRKWDAQPF